MSIEIAALIVEAVSAVGGLLSEADRRKAGAKSHSLSVALHHVDVENALHGISNVTLASMMTGTMTAKLADEILEDREVKSLVRELLLVTILGDDETKSLDRLTDAISIRVSVLLDGRAASEDTLSFGRELGRICCLLAANIADQARLENPSALFAAQHIGHLKRLTSIVESIDRHTAAVNRTADAEKRARRDAFVREYRRLCAEFHGVIQPPDFETNQKVPLEELYVAPTILASSSNTPERGSEMGLSDFVASVDRTVLLGDPGGGKSTLSSYVTMTMARAHTGPTPLFVTLREYAKDSTGKSILRYIEANIPNRYQIETEPGLIEDLLLTGSAAVVFDGLDELIDTTKRRQITSEVEMFASRYPLTSILVTSRRVGYDQARLDPAVFDVRQIGEFGAPQVAEYVRKWFQSQSGYSDIEAEEKSVNFITQSEAVPDLRSNPLMLALMCIIFRGEQVIPRKRPAIYEKCANLLFEKWDGHRQIEVPLQARDHVDAAMKYVAFQFLETNSEDSGITYSKLVSMMTDYLHTRALETKDAAEKAAAEFVDFCRGRAWVFTDAGTTADGEQIYTFTHRTFMEYFAAVHLVRMTDSPEAIARQLLPKVARQEWDVVAQLAIQQADKTSDRGSERVLRVMLDEKRKRTAENRANVLTFVGRCSRFAVLSPGFISLLTRRVFEFYFENFAPIMSDPYVDPYAPWFTLDESLGDEHAGTASVAVVELVESRLEEADERVKAAAISIVLLAGIRVTNRSRMRPEPIATLDQAIHSIGARRIEYFESFARSNPHAWNPLAIGMLVDVDRAVDAMYASGLSFAEIYFEYFSDDIVIPSTPLAEQIISPSTFAVAKVTPTGLSLLSALATRMLSDFRAGRDRSMSGDAHLFFATNALHHIHEREGVSEYEQAVRDALVLTSLAAVATNPGEMGVDDGGVRPSEGASRREVHAERLLQLNPSVDIASFVSDWAVGGAELLILSDSK